MLSFFRQQILQSSKSQKLALSREGSRRLTLACSANFVWWIVLPFSTVSEGSSTHFEETAMSCCLGMVSDRTASACG